MDENCWILRGAAFHQNLNKTTKFSYHNHNKQMHNVINTLSFYLRNPGWQSYKPNCRATIRAIQSLKRRDLIETNQFNQARYKVNSNSGAKIIKENT